MSKDNKAAGNKPAESNVVSMNQCKAEKCSKKEEKMGFCKEHFTWFKEGLISRDGKRPSDFDKKYQAFLQKSGGKAA
jgi:hypothetical protein